MIELPNVTLQAAKAGFKAGYTDYEGHCRDGLMAAMDPALGPDRLVVAGSHEQEIIERIVAWLEEDPDGTPKEWRRVASEIVARFGDGP